MSDPNDDTTTVLAGSVVARRGDVGAPFGEVSIHRPRTGGPTAPGGDVVDLRCEARDLPDSRNAAPATDLDHVVHVLCSRFTDPQAIECFLEATRGLIDDYVIGREAWFEVVADPEAPRGAPDDRLLVDDVFVARYPTVDSWLALHDWEPWKRAVEALEAEAATMFHLVLRPRVNRLAAHR